MTKLAKITFTDWAGLINGRIATIHGANGTSLRYVHSRDVPADRLFIMEGRDGTKHTLDGDGTDDARLDAHFRGFQQNNA